MSWPDYDVVLGMVKKKESKQNQPEYRRPLGNIEQILLNMGSIGVNHIVKTVIFSSDNPISLKSVDIALLRLAERHPLLRVKIKRYISDYNVNDWLIPMDKMHVNVEELPHKMWLDVMEQQLSESGINIEKGPLWHVKFLPNINTEDPHVKLPHQHALIFVFDHAICDDNSMLRIINETLLYLENEMNGFENYDKVDSLPFPESLCNLPDVEHRLPLSLKVFQLLISWIPSIMGWVVTRLIAKDNTKNLNSNLVSPTAAISASHVVPIVFNQSETMKLTNSCKAENVSPFAAFQAAVLTILNDKLSLPREFKLNIPVNIRQYYSKLKQDYIYQQVANYVTFISFDNPC